MTQQTESVVEACRGMSADQIEAAIRSSVHGETIQDPEALALYLEALASGDAGSGDVSEIPESDNPEPGIVEGIMIDEA